MSADAEAGPAPGFVPLFRTSPLLDTLGPFYGKGRGADLVIGLRIAGKHANARGTLHGGVVATLCDVALGYTLAYSTDPPLKLITASMTIDYTGSARVGDWIEARVESAKTGKTLAFANAYLSLGDRRIARASAVFAVAGPGD